MFSESFSFALDLPHASFLKEGVVASVGLWFVFSVVAILLGLSASLWAGYQKRKNQREPKSSSGRDLGKGYGVFFLFYSLLLGAMGYSQGTCPCHGLGQVFIFLSWGLLLFSLLLGKAYRLSSLGRYTGFLLGIFSLVVAYAGLEPYKGASLSGTPLFWRDLHVGLALLAYSFFAFGAVSAGAFLVQNARLKTHQVGAKLQELPSVTLLSRVIPRAVFCGWVLLLGSLLTLGGVGQWAPTTKLILSAVVFVGYAFWWGVQIFRGMPMRLFCAGVLILFGVAMSVLFFSK